MRQALKFNLFVEKHEAWSIFDEINAIFLRLPLDISPEIANQTYQLLLPLDITMAELF